MYRWMNGQHLRSLPSDLLIKDFEDRWKNTGILLETESGFAKVRLQLLFLTSGVSVLWNYLLKGYANVFDPVFGFKSFCSF
jgi:hypothetical protein